MFQIIHMTALVLLTTIHANSVIQHIRVTPLIEISNSQDTVLQETVHNLHLQLNIQAIDNHLTQLGKIVERGLEDIQKNYNNTGEAKFTVTRTTHGYNLDTQNSSKAYFTTMLGKLQIQLLQTITELGKN